MTPDDVIALRRSWQGVIFEDATGHGVNLDASISGTTILASSDWLAYVMAMAAALPDGERITYPTEYECRWAWPEGVTIVFAHPLELDTTIVSHDEGGKRVKDVPHYEQNVVQAISIGPLKSMPAQHPDGSVRGAIELRPTMSIGVNPTDITQGHLPLGEEVHAAAGRIDPWGRFLLAMVTALGHRLTTLAEPSGLDRAAQRRLGRSMVSDLRVLELASGATVTSKGGSVEWQKRWLVRGHWRSQPYGPGSVLRKVIWIDQFIKGPADKPLEIRPTIWKTDP